MGDELLVVRDAEGSPCSIDREERILVSSMIAQRKETGQFLVVKLYANNECVFIRLPISVV